MSHNPSDRYATLTAEAAQIAALPAPKRTSAVTWFVLAAETAGISRRTAEQIIRNAFEAAQ